MVPLGVYRDLTGARHVRLRVPNAPATQFQTWEAVRDALLGSGLPVRSSGAVGFDVQADLFDLGGSLLGIGSPHRGVLDLPLLDPVDAPLPRPGLSLGGVPGRPSGGAPLLLLPADHDLHGHLTRWQAEAAAQGWATRLPLSGDNQVLLTFTRAPSTVTLTGVRLDSGAWGFTLERDTWEYLHLMSNIQSL
ncbi:hypothetical protein GCM10008960_11720 [Deinococcus sedimenti]|uniref:Uncharacterized protein n=1 Tax=Deinococcus sedimenti TaxID=1867090 RepID=A0ABQ2S2Q3_9DEIO|nr:hypothetical protein GCM10008960_11720 [Deinococcus sedimenti]